MLLVPLTSAGPPEINQQFFAPDQYEFSQMDDPPRIPENTSFSGKVIEPIVQSERFSLAQQQHEGGTEVIFHDYATPNTLKMEVQLSSTDPQEDGGNPSFHPSQPLRNVIQYPRPASPTNVSAANVPSYGMKSPARSSTYLLKNYCGAGGDTAGAFKAEINWI